MFGFAKIFEFLAPHDCLMCGRPGDLLCAGCLPATTTPPVRVNAQELGLDNIWIGTDYSGMVRQLVRKYKFERSADSADILAAILIRSLPPLPPDTIVTYVPTTTNRIRQRGYDHARKLAASVARMRSLSMQSALVRHGQQQQVGATRAVRRRQMADAYTVRRGANIRGSKILLIDDIATTGTTLQIATQVLMASGAQSVDAAVVAYKQ